VSPTAKTTSKSGAKTAKTASKSRAKSGTTTVKVDLPDEIFDVQVNIPLMHQVVVAQQAAARQGTASTKRRGEVRGGGRKPYKQKGTGRARQGSTRAPQFAGGGVVHGPKPRDYDQRTPKKMKAAALRGALSDRARNDRIHVVESLISADKPSTRTVLAALADLSERHGFLVVLERTDAITWLSLRNAPEVHIVAVDQLNTYDVLASEDVVFTKGAYDAFVGSAARARERVSAGSRTDKPATIVGASANDAVPTEDVPSAPATGDYPKSAAPLDSGEAPKGFTIKGNTTSMKYHAPEGQWYDATLAEVWFKTAKDAEAAGFVKAGSKAGSKAAIKRNESEEGDK